MSRIDKKTGNIIVQKGDSLSRIAKSSGRSLSDLLVANPRYKSNPDLIQPNDVIKSPIGPALPSGPSYDSLTQSSNQPQGPASLPENTGGGESMSAILKQILQRSQQSASDEFIGNDVALRAGGEQIDQTNADIYSQDLENANISNAARLSLLGNDGSIQNSGLRSIENQQRNNLNKYNAATDTIDSAQKAYQDEQDRAFDERKFEEDKRQFGIKAAQDAQKASEKANEIDFDKTTNVSETAKIFTEIKGEDNYIDPAVWMQTRDSWQSNGGSDSSYISNFKRFLNPQSYDQAGIKDSSTSASMLLLQKIEEAVAAEELVN